MTVSPGFRKKLLVSVALGVLVFFALSIYADMGRIAAVFRVFDWSYLPFILLLALANYLLRFLRWDYYLSRLEIRIGRKESLTIFMTGLAMSVTPGKVGELLKSYLLKELNGTPLSRSAPVVVAERITDFAAVVLLSSFGVVFFGYGMKALALSAVLILALLAVAGYRPLFLGVLRLLSRIPVIAKVTSRLETAYDSTSTLLSPIPLLWATAIALASWFAECYALYLVFKGFNAPTQVSTATFIYAFSTLVGALSMLPGGLGATEGSMMSLLVYTGSPVATAVAATLIIRVCTLWFAVLLGLAALMRLPGAVIIGAEPDEK